MNQARPYTMRTRAASKEATRLRIIRSMLDLTSTHVVSDIALDDVAARAGVSVQTVLRHFGNRAELIRATSAYGARVVAEERRAPAGDTAGALRLLEDHYERRGDTTVLLLAQEASDETIGDVVRRGREVHRAWVEETFGPAVAQLPAAGRTTALDLLAVVTDVYTWKQLRRDQGASRDVVRTRIAALVAAVLASAASAKEH